MGLPLWLPLVAIPLFFYLYVRINDAKIARLTADAALFSGKRWTLEDVKQTATSAALKGPSASLFSPEELSPKTGRRYVVVGGVSAISLARPLSLHHITAVFRYFCERCLGTQRIFALRPDSWEDGLSST